MLTKFVGAIGVILILLTAGMLWVPSEASAIYINFKRGSVKCEEVITGVSRTELNSDAVVCAIRITEIERWCTNKPDNSPHANGTPFAVNAEIVEVNQGSTLPLSKQGKSFSLITFSDDEIRAFLGDAVNPALVCPNPNWHVNIAVTKFDGIGEVVSQPGGGCIVDSNLFDVGSCVVSALASGCHQEECLRVSPCVEGSSDTYACTCVEHLKDGVSQNQCKYGIN